MNNSATGRATRTGGWAGLLSRIAAGKATVLPKAAHTKSILQISRPPALSDDTLALTVISQ